MQLEHRETLERQASLELLVLLVELDLWAWLAQQDLWDRLEPLEEQDSPGLLVILDRKDLRVKQAILVHLDPMDSQVSLLVSLLKFLSSIPCASVSFCISFAHVIVVSCILRINCIYCFCYFVDIKHLFQNCGEHICTDTLQNSNIYTHTHTHTHMHVPGHYYW